jgi:Arc/MetJ-type ribon-helix-helix transcriptional regulator
MPKRPIPLCTGLLMIDKDGQLRYVREALRLLEDHDQVRAAHLAGFRKEIDRRLASLDRGESVDGEEFFAELERDEAALRRKRKAK